jgi:hypothetical protein
MMLNLLLDFMPFLGLIMGFVLATLYRKVGHPSPLVWGRILPDLGPVRAHEVLEYNEQIESKEPHRGRLGREVRRRNFAVNWGYLGAGVTNTVLFQRALLFEKDTIDARKPGSEYELSELATLELLDEATKLRWEQVRCQITLQLRAKLRLKIDKEDFLTLFVRYKVLEEHMLSLAGTKGTWLHGMMMERLGLTEWGLIDGGSSTPA